MGSIRRRRVQRGWGLALGKEESWMYSEQAQLWHRERNDGSSPVSKEEGGYEQPCWQQGDNVDRPNRPWVQEGRLLFAHISHPCTSLLRASLGKIKVIHRKGAGQPSPMVPEAAQSPSPALPAKHGLAYLGWGRGNGARLCLPRKKIDAQSKCPGCLPQPGLKQRRHVRKWPAGKENKEKIRNLPLSGEGTVGSSCFCCF